jgi:hypothetical protein
MIIVILTTILPPLVSLQQSPQISIDLKKETSDRDKKQRQRQGAEAEAEAAAEDTALTRKTMILYVVSIQQLSKLNDYIVVLY